MPNEIVGLLRSKVTLRWPDGCEVALPARELRLRCRCAQCVDEGSGRPLVEPAKISPQIRAKRIELVGQYGMTIEWSESPCANIYNFQDLKRLCACDRCRASRPSV
jgi:ATP-binding protein involved in chromosome partitioning